MPVAFEKPWSGVASARSLSLSFVNTLDWRLRQPSVELLLGYSDVARWARTVGVLDPAQAEALRAWSEAHPRIATRALAEAVEVREAIASVLLAGYRGEPAPSGPLARLERACLGAMAARRLQAGADGAAWVWRNPDAEPERPAWAAALDAERILTSELREHVRQCDDAECGWMFLDTSRNHRRRWCSMQGCGNRNKARRFYRRSASGGNTPTEEESGT